MNIKIDGYDMILKKEEYQNGKTALVIIIGNGNDALEEMGMQPGDEYTVVTVNLPNVELQDNEICVKNYTENEGLFEQLIEQKILRDTGRKVKTGFVSIPIAELLISKEKLWKL